jgi:hypothetical protein
MTVSELIELLQGYPQDLPIVALHPRHDYWHRLAIDTMVGVDTANLDLSSDAPNNWQVREASEDTTECVVLF